VVVCGYKGRWWGITYDEDTETEDAAQDQFSTDTFSYTGKCDGVRVTGGWDVPFY